MEPQPILTPLTSAAVFLLATVERGAEARVRDALTEVGGLSRTVGFRDPGATLSVVVGIGSDAYDRLFAGPRPAGLHPFRPLAGARHAAPATKADLLVHIRARRMDLCFEVADLLTQKLAGAVAVVDEVHGFRYFDNRDLLGFVDGTENPTGPEAADHVLIGQEDETYAGGSYVIVQKYLHQIADWNGLTTEDQERVIGRSKLANVEMPDDLKPADSHVALTVIEDPDGTEHKILRDNMPFGSIATGDRGTYFIGYARTPLVIEQMLTNMFIGNPPGTTDRILDFSTAVTGALFFVPTTDFLDDPPEGPGTAFGPSIGESGSDPDDGRPAVGDSLPDKRSDDRGLRIGSLNTRRGATSS